jgi:hypothetical protein
MPEERGFGSTGASRLAAHRTSCFLAAGLPCSLTVTTGTRAPHTGAPGRSPGRTPSCGTRRWPATATVTGTAARQRRRRAGPSCGCGSVPSAMTPTPQHWRSCSEILPSRSGPRTPGNHPTLARAHPLRSNLTSPQRDREQPYAARGGSERSLGRPTCSPARPTSATASLTRHRRVGSMKASR